MYIIGVILFCILEIMQVSKGMGKISKGNSAAGVTCAEGINYRRPKLTNPKPFRLRTDVRQRFCTSSEFI